MREDAMRRLTPHATLTAVVLNIAIAVTCAHAQTSVRMLVGSPAGGADLTHVPYRGSGPPSSDLLAGHALFGFTQIPNVTPHVPDKRLKAIAVTGERRSRLLPQTPTMAELGHGELSGAVWFGLFIKAGAPEATQTRLLRAAKAAHEDPAIRAKLEAQGFDVSGLSGAEFLASISQQSERWARIVKATGFKAE